MFLLLHLLIFYNLIIWKPCVSYYKGRTTDRIKGKLNKLSEELLIDATSKIDSIQHLKKIYCKKVQYQYGSLVYKMRFRYKRMIELYTSISDDMETSADQDKYGWKYLGVIPVMDNLVHELHNFGDMIKIHETNMHAEKSKTGYDLFFRRINMAPIWLGLLDSMHNSDPPEPRPEEHNLTRTGNRSNGVWHYAVPNRMI